MSDRSVYESKLSRVRQTIRCENQNVSTAFMGKSCGFSYYGMSLSEVLKYPLKAAKTSVNYVETIEKQAGQVLCFNGFQPTNITIPLAKVSFSKILSPGIELDDDVIWQVDEQEIMKKEDYAKLIRNGYEWFFNKFFFKVVKRSVYIDYLRKEERYQSLGYEYAYSHGFPVLANCMEVAATPFESLAGARGIKQFFMDCHEDITLVSEAIEVFWAGYRKHIVKIIKSRENQDDYIGAFITGQRSASNMINHDWFARLVLPYLLDFGNILIQSGKVPIFHLDLNWDREIEFIKNFPEKTVMINTDGNTSQKNIREKLGDNYALIGDIPHTLLLYGSESEVREYIIRQLDEIGAKGLFVCPGCDAPYGTPHENFIAMYQAAYQWH